MDLCVLGVSVRHETIECVCRSRDVVAKRFSEMCAGHDNSIGGIPYSKKISTLSISATSEDHC